MAKTAMGPIAPPEGRGIVAKPPIVRGPIHLPPPMTRYTVTGTDVAPESSFSNKDAMLAFIRAHLPAHTGTVTITIHTVLAE